MDKIIKYLYRKIAHILPTRLVYYCIIRAWGNGIRGFEYKKTDPSNVRIRTILKRWQKDNNL